MQSFLNLFFRESKVVFKVGVIVIVLILGQHMIRSASAQNDQPVADAGGPYSGPAQQAVQLSGLRSWDQDGSITNYSWDFGDGTNGSGEAPTHSYASEGSYTVTLTVTDSNGNTSSSQSTVTVDAQTSAQ